MSIHSSGGGVLFDMDGTLVDTEPHWQAAQEALAESIGTTWTQEDFEASIGRPMAHWAEVLRARGLPGSLEEIIDRAVAFVSERMRAEMPWLPGAYELLEQLAAEGVRCGLVTNNAAVNAALLADAAPAGSLQVLVSANDVTSSKPHPEPYLTAIARLGIDAAHSIAFEDSASGARSAHQAGLGVWFINSHTADPGVPTARVIGSPAEVTAAEVHAALAGARTATPA